MTVYFRGQELFTRSSLNPDGFNLEYALWDIGPGIIAVIGGALVGAILAYISSQWLFGRRAPIADTFLNLSQKRGCDSNAIMPPKPPSYKSSE